VTGSSSHAQAWRTAELGKPIGMGLAILIVGTAPWLVLFPFNVRIAPDVPWAAGATGLYLFLLLIWLGGAGWPRRWSGFRRRSLRLRRPVGPSDEGPAIGAIVLFLGLLYVAWILIGRAAGPPDLSGYPTTSIRLSAFIMGGLISGVVEEAAFRGYMQSNLERFGPGMAIGATSLVFALAHGVHGLQALVLLGPGLFLASVLYGLLAYKTGSILPGIVIHVSGDLARTYFGVLGGDARLLFAS
jgi:membrane protease YdiL (CAAX protease family)